MGGYGGASGNAKGKCYYDTGGHKVTDKNAIEVAEHYIREGKYVAFLQQKPPDKRADLSVEGFHVEVKGISSTNPSQVASKIKQGFEQLEVDMSRYSKEDRRPTKVIILSKHESFSEGYNSACEGYKEAVRKGDVKGSVEFWYHNKIHILR